MDLLRKLDEWLGEPPMAFFAWALSSGGLLLSLDAIGVIGSDNAALVFVAGFFAATLIYFLVRAVIHWLIDRDERRRAVRRMLAARETTRPDRVD